MGCSTAQNEEESGVAVAEKEAAIAEHVKVVGAAEAALEKADTEHSSLHKEYQGMCAGVATEKEESRTLTDQVVYLFFWERIVFFLS